jgi:uncharacterized protein
MTDVTPLVRAGTCIIQSYGPHGVKVLGQVYPAPTLITPDGVRAWDGNLPSLWTDYTGMFDLLVLARPGGMTEEDLTLKYQAKTAGINLEIMTLDAACRTYNVLVAEGRRVAIAY